MIILLGRPVIDIIQLYILSIDSIRDTNMVSGLAYYTANTCSLLYESYKNLECFAIVAIIYLIILK